ncbi:MAG: ZIP family metal transporter [Bacteroidetes bacterium]|nr:ZIP family metal transporter [Bacteroidota bacterium]
MTSELLCLLLFATVILSGCSVLFFKLSSKTLKLILSFSGAYLLGITVLHLLPELYTSPPTPLPWGRGVGIFILAGFLLQIFIEYFSEGIEHGHIHVHKYEENIFPITVMIALSVHSFLEGMPLAGTINGTKRSLATGIIFHNIPIAIALMSMLIQSGQKKARAIIWLVVFALMTPIGALTGNLLEGSFGLITYYSNYLMAVVVGIFLHVSTTILFESSEQHRFHLIKLATILAGMGLAFVSI